MARGNGQHAKQATQTATKLSDFIKANTASQEAISREYVDWAEVDHRLVTGAIVAAVRQGGALLFGCSRDKKSYSIKVYADGEGTPFYFPCNASGIDDMERMLTRIIETAEWE